MIKYISKSTQKDRDEVLSMCRNRWYHGEQFRGYTIEQAQRDMPHIKYINSRLSDLHVLGLLRQEILPYGKLLYIYIPKKTRLG